MKLGGILYSYNEINKWVWGFAHSVMCLFKVGKIRICLTAIHGSEEGSAGCCTWSLIWILRVVWRNVEWHRTSHPVSPSSRRDVPSTLSVGTCIPVHTPSLTYSPHLPGHCLSQSVPRETHTHTHTHTHTVHNFFVSRKWRNIYKTCKSFDRDNKLLSLWLRWALFVVCSCTAPLFILRKTN